MLCLQTWKCKEKIPTCFICLSNLLNRLKAQIWKTLFWGALEWPLSEKCWRGRGNSLIIQSKGLTRHGHRFRSVGFFFLYLAVFLQQAPQTYIKSKIQQQIWSPSCFVWIHCIITCFCIIVWNIIPVHRTECPLVQIWWPTRSATAYDNKAPPGELLPTGWLASLGVGSL